MVLPGFSAFSVDEALSSYHLLKEHGYDVRLKYPNASDGNDQYQISDPEQLETLLRSNVLFRDTIAAEGVVLEADLAINPDTGKIDTYSVGKLEIKGQAYSFITSQFDTTPGNDPMEHQKFGGGDIFIVKGDFAQLESKFAQYQTQLESDLNTEAALTAIIKSAQFLTQFINTYKPETSRISVDCVSGRLNPGSDVIVSGITDITARTGGYCPATTEALLLMKKTGTDMAKAKVQLIYHPEQNQIPEGGKYIDHPDLVIIASAENLEP